MIRRTRCACGQVSATVEGDPARVFACHCDYCQRRTGSVFQVSCYYPHEQVLELTGETRTFGDSSASIGIIYEFCPNCGTTVHWSYGPRMIERYPHLAGFRGFAVGCFVDPDFPPPQVELQRQYAHRWMPPITGAASFDDFGDTARTISG